MLIKCIKTFHFKNKLHILLAIPCRLISITEARRIMQLSDTDRRISDEDLKKQYLKLAKIYHPDSSNSKGTDVITFQD